MRNQPTRKKKSNQTDFPKVPSTSLGSSLFSGVFQGFSFGAGSSIAHNIFRNPFAGAQIYPEKPSAACQILQKEYIDLCQINPAFETTKCQQLFKDLQLVCEGEKENKKLDPVKEVW